MNTLHIKKGDTVVVLTGKDKGTKGKVAKAFPKLGKILVEGVNVRKAHQKKTRNAKGQTITKTLPIDASNVKLAK
jgi:large subunit ribosomal protein L24